MRGRDVTLEAEDGGLFSAYFAQPTATPAPGIVVLQEIFGINSFVRQVVDRMAAAGFAAIAPDLFWRQEPGVKLNPDHPDDRARGTALLKGLEERLAVEDAIVAMEHLRDSAGAGKVGALGYCLGGKLAYLMAARSNVDASVSYYGVGIQGALDEAQKIRTPLLLHIAGADHLCPPEAQARIADALKAHGERTRIHTYERAGHGFARTESSAYEADAAQRADALTLEFLEANLR